MNIKDIYDKMRHGEDLSDEEVLFAYPKFRDLAMTLSEFGDPFYTGMCEANRQACQLEGWWFARTGKMLG